MTYNRNSGFFPPKRHRIQGVLGRFVSAQCFYIGIFNKEAESRSRKCKHSQSLDLRRIPLQFPGLGGLYFSLGNGPELQFARLKRRVALGVVICILKHHPTKAHECKLAVFSQGLQRERVREKKEGASPKVVEPRKFFLF